jgi:hypothetical protein
MARRTAGRRAEILLSMEPPSETGNGDTKGLDGEGRFSEKRRLRDIPEGFLAANLHGGSSVQENP